MNYIKRTIEDRFLQMNDSFEAVLLTGARHVGKTTMLRHLSEGEKRSYVTLDHMMVRNLAITDPVLFFQTYKPPILIDEIQYAPELFEQIKVLCEESGEKGLFWLTASQHGYSGNPECQSLAGKLGVLELHSLSRNEIEGIHFGNELDFSLPCLLERQRSSPKNDLIQIFERIWRGGMPQLLGAGAEQRSAYYESYVDSYLMRDATQLGGITDLLKFRKFVTACAALVSTQVNYKILAEASDISQPTAKEWLGLLDKLGVVYMLKAYDDKRFKRLTKTPKLYFYDTGLCAYLSRWLSAEALRNGAAGRNFFECYVISELIKSFAGDGMQVEISHFRDAKAKEISLLIDRNQVIHPLEIKLSANPDVKEIRKFSILDTVHKERGAGGILCMCQEVVPVDTKDCYIPCNLI